MITSRAAKYRKVEITRKQNTKVPQAWEKEIQYGLCHFAWPNKRLTILKFATCNSLFYFILIGVVHPLQSVRFNQGW